VIARKATATATEWAVTQLQSPSIALNNGSIRCASVGSPTKPRPMLASVMPSWVAAMEALSVSMAASTDFEPRTPLAIISSTRVLRTEMSENSAATNNPLRKMRAGTSDRSRREPVKQLLPLPPGVQGRPQPLHLLRQLRCQIFLLVRVAGNLEQFRLARHRH